MEDIDAILHSAYIIDGLRMDATPAQMMSECMPYGDTACSAEEVCRTIVDEPADPSPGSAVYSKDRIKEYDRSRHTRRDIMIGLEKSQAA